MTQRDNSELPAMLSRQERAMAKSQAPEAAPPEGSGRTAGKWRI